MKRIGILKKDLEKLRRLPEGSEIVTRYNRTRYALRWFHDTRYKHLFKVYYVASYLFGKTYIPIGQVELVVVDENPFKRKRIREQNDHA